MLEASPDNSSLGRRCWSSLKMHIGQCLRTFLFISEECLSSKVLFYGTPSSLPWQFGDHLLKVFKQSVDPVLHFIRHPSVAVGTWQYFVLKLMTVGRNFFLKSDSPNLDSKSSTYVVKCVLCVYASPHVMSVAYARMSKPFLEAVTNSYLHSTFLGNTPRPISQCVCPWNWTAHRFQHSRWRASSPQITVWATLCDFQCYCGFVQWKLQTMLRVIAVIT